jgi:hypothetical protein
MLILRCQADKNHTICLHGLLTNIWVSLTSLTFDVQCSFFSPVRSCQVSKCQWCQFGCQYICQHLCQYDLINISVYECQFSTFSVTIAQYNHIYTYGGFLKWGYPPIIHSIFHYKLSILGYHHLTKSTYDYIYIYTHVCI